MDYGPAPGEAAPRAGAPGSDLSYDFSSQPWLGHRIERPLASGWIDGWRGPQRMTTTDDRQWLERARAGDRVAFGKLVRQHQQRVHRLALHLTGNAGEADDVTQETFLRAYRAIGSFDARADLFTWLYRICVNVALNLRRQRKRVTTDINDPRMPEPAFEGVGADPAHAAEQAQAYRELAQAMDGLSEALRTTLIMACVDQLPYRDIAQVLGCSEGTVAWRVHEARRQLRETLSDASVERFERLGEKGGGRGRRA